MEGEGGVPKKSRKTRGRTKGRKRTKIKWVVVVFRVCANCESEKTKAEMKRRKRE